MISVVMIMAVVVFGCGIAWHDEPSRGPSGTWPQSRRECD
jgi:hypothetical protein